MEVKIKICGLKSMADVTYANRCKPDYVGFVFAPSSRQVTRDFALHMREELDAGIPAVGVFVKERIPVISALCREGTIQMVQLHGEEDVAYIQKLRQEVDVPIIRAVRVKDMETIPALKDLPVDYFLLDAYVKGRYGGSGITFDLSWIPREWNRPYFLAGGLNGNNLPDALEACQPYCVDVSSGAETDGKKDYEKMRELVDLIRQHSKR